MNPVSRRLAIAAAVYSCAVLRPLPANADPIPDPSFGVDGVVWTDFGTNNNDTSRDLLIQPDGNILTAGFSATSGNAYLIAMTRHFPEGQPDSADFGVDGQVLTSFTFRDVADAIALQDDGKIVAAGMQSISNGSSDHISSVYRFHADGTVDSSFAGDGEVALRYGTGLSGEFAGVTVLPDGKILAAGKSQNGFGAMRFLPDGTLDNTYDSDGRVLIPAVIWGFRGSCAFLEDGGILWANLIAGGPNGLFGMARVDSDGIPYPGFNGLTGIEAAAGNRVFRVRELPDGKILLAGTTVQGLTRFSALRFFADGAPDSSFGTNGRTDVVFSPNGSELYDMTVGDDGKILLAGIVGVGQGQVGLARLNPDGSLDVTFAPGGKIVSNLNPSSTTYLTRVVILPDGKILGAGWSSRGSGGDFFLVRYMFEPSDVPEAGGDLDPALSRAFPNPTRDETTIRLQLNLEGAVSVEIFDVSGRAVRHLFDGTLPAGATALRWDGRDDSGGVAPAGIFLARISTSERTETRKLIRRR